MYLICRFSSDWPKDICLTEGGLRKIYLIRRNWQKS